MGKAYYQWGLLLCTCQISLPDKAEQNLLKIVPGLLGFFGFFSERQGPSQAGLHLTCLALSLHSDHPKFPRSPEPSHCVLPLPGHGPLSLTRTCFFTGQKSRSFFAPAHTESFHILFTLHSGPSRGAARAIARPMLTLTRGVPNLLPPQQPCCGCFCARVTCT